MGDGDTPANGEAFTKKSEKKGHEATQEAGNIGMKQEATLSSAEHHDQAQQKPGYWGDPSTHSAGGYWNHYQYGHYNHAPGPWAQHGQWMPGTPVHVPGYPEGTFVFGGWSGDQAYYINNATQQSVWARELFGAGPPPPHVQYTPPSKQYGAALAAEATRRAHERKYGQAHAAHPPVYGDRHHQWAPQHHPSHPPGSWDPWQQHQQVLPFVLTSQYHAARFARTNVVMVWSDSPTSNCFLAVAIHMR